MPTVPFATFPMREVQADRQDQPGTWFNAKAVEDAVTDLNEEAGNLGYAFADINPAYDRDAEHHIMNVTFKVGEHAARLCRADRHHRQHDHPRQGDPPRVPLNEGDAFNALKVKRSQDRMQSLGFFQDKLEIKQTEGSTPDRVVLGVNVEEKPTGQLSLSGGYSSLERFVVQLAICAEQFHGQGPDARRLGRLVGSIPSRSQLGFVEPYFLDKPILLGAQIFRRDYNSFNFVGDTAQHDLFAAQHRRRSADGFPDHRILELRHAATRSVGQRHRSTMAVLHRPDGRDRSRRLRPAQGRSLSCATKSASD